MKSVLGLSLAGALVLAQPASAEIKIGFTVPATGVVAVYGIPILKTIPLLPKTIGGEPVTYISLDSNSDPTKGAANTRKLVTDDHVDVVIGDVAAPTTMAMIDIIAEAKTPLIAPTSAVQVVLPMDEKRKWAFKIVPSDDIGADAVVKHMVSQGIKKLGFIGFNDAYGQIWQQHLHDRLPKAGIELVDEETFSRTDTSVVAQALKLVAAKPDAILVGAGGTPAIVPAHDLRARGFTGTIYQVHAVATPVFIQRGGKDVDGNIFAGEPFTIYKDLPEDSPWRKLAQKYIDDYAAANGGEPASIFGAHIIDIMTLLVPAIETALKTTKPGTPEFRAAIRDQLEQAKDVYLNNGYLEANSPTNHSGFSARGVFMIKVENGDFHLIK